jgi:pyruvate/2-oxoacid:ferredoxin oxidoreductase beta subunit
MMKFLSPLSFGIRHSLFIIRYSFLVPACPGCGQVFYFSSLVTQETGNLIRINIYLAPSIHSPHSGVAARQ